MTKKILIAGFACLSVIAVAQSSGSKDQSASAAKDQHPKDVATGQASGRVAPMKLTSAQPAITDNKKTASATSDSASSEPVKAPRDLATGQSSGKRQYQPVVIRKVSDDATPEAREQQSPKATGKTSINDDWTNGKKTAQDDWHVSNAKGNGSGNITVPPADLDGDGKADRTSAPSSTSNAQARVAKGDVNGDGKADVTATTNTGANGQNAAINNSHSNIKNSKDAASGRTTPKRQHWDITISK